MSDNLLIFCSDVSDTLVGGGSYVCDTLLFCWSDLSYTQGYRKFETVQNNRILNPKLSDQMRGILIK